MPEILTYVICTRYLESNTITFLSMIDIGDEECIHTETAVVTDDLINQLCFCFFFMPSILVCIPQKQIMPFD